MATNQVFLAKTIIPDFGTTVHANEATTISRRLKLTTDENPVDNFRCFAGCEHYKGMG